MRLCESIFRPPKPSAPSAALVLVLGTLGCEGPLAPQTIVGDYTLLEVGGAPLPVVNPQGQCPFELPREAVGTEVLVVSGTLTIGGTDFTLLLQQQTVTCRDTGEIVDIVPFEWAASGTYQMTGTFTLIFLDHSSGDERLLGSGKVEGSRLRVSYNPDYALYEEMLFQK